MSRMRPASWVFVIGWLLLGVWQITGGEILQGIVLILFGLANLVFELRRPRQDSNLGPSD